MKDKVYNCPFCGAKKAIWNSDTYSINYCEKCSKILIVLNNAKSNDIVTKLLLDYIHSMRGDF